MAQQAPGIKSLRNKTTQPLSITADVGGRDEGKSRPAITYTLPPVEAGAKVGSTVEVKPEHRAALASSKALQRWVDRGMVLAA